MELLQENKARGKRGTSVHGRALSRGDDSIFVATHTGVVEIPLKGIQSVETRPGGDPDLVTVAVSDASMIGQKLTITPRPMPETEPGWGGTGPAGPKRWLPKSQLVGKTTWTLDDCSDTATSSGKPSVPDSTDDHICTRFNDDDLG